jgi:hypothetical protein
MVQGYVKNRFKKRDDRSDLNPSYKRDTEAQIGELFFSRETGKLSFKKGVGDFIRYEDSQSSSQPLPYKAYTAILLQSGNGSDDTVALNSGFLTVGVTYLINDSRGVDFTNVGAPDNNQGTYFIATGTTPNSWGFYEGNPEVDILISYTSAPTVKVLENTLNVYAYFERVGEGDYLAIFNEGLFMSTSAYVTISNPAFTNTLGVGELVVCQAVPFFFNVVNIRTSSNGSPADGILGSGLAASILEIRIYNDEII